MSLTTDQKLRTDIRYCLTVTNVHQNRGFTQDNVTKYNHKITFVDKFGVQYLCEYVTLEPRQGDFVPNQKASFRVLGYNNMGNPEITPAHGHDQSVEKILLYGGARPVFGETYNLALGHAATVYAAMISKMKVAPDKEKAIQDVTEMAEEFDQYLMVKMTERLVGE